MKPLSEFGYGTLLTGLTENEEKAVSQPLIKFEKTKGTLFCQTLKVEGKN